MVVSDIGDILSPKMAPEMIAPAMMPTFASSPCARAMQATPAVPAEVQDEPVRTDITQQTKNALRYRNLGLISSKP